MLLGDDVLFDGVIHNPLKEVELLFFVQGPVDFPAQLVFGNAAKAFCLFRGFCEEDGLRLPCGDELKEVAGGRVVERPRVAIGVHPLVASVEAFNLSRVGGSGLLDGLPSLFGGREANALEAELGNRNDFTRRLALCLSLEL